MQILAQGTCYSPQIVPACSGNGDVQLPFGTAVYVGLGALVFAMLVFLELFGWTAFSIRRWCMCLNMGRGKPRNSGEAAACFAPPASTIAADAARIHIERVSFLPCQICLPEKRRSGHRAAIRVSAAYHVCCTHQLDVCV